METEKILEKLVNSPETGFQGIEKIYHKAWQYGISKEEVKEYLQSQALHQIHTKTKQVYQRILPENPQDLWEVDLIDMTDYRRYNKEAGKRQSYGWILNVIDSFSKYALSQPLYTKNVGDVAAAFTEILKIAKTKPKTLQSDNGPEFNNKQWNKIMSDNKILQYRTTPYTPYSNGMIERFNRTLKQMLFQYFDKIQSFKWYDVLDKFIDNYNNSYHSTIQIEPAKVSDKNKDKIQRLYEAKLYDESINNSNEYNIGDKVRLKLDLGNFDKKYKQRFSDKIYTIIMKYNGMEGYIYDKYRINDDNGNTLPKKYSYYDLVLVPKENNIDRRKTKEYHKTVRSAKKTQIELNQPKDLAIENTIKVKENKPIELGNKRLQPKSDKRIKPIEEDKTGHYEVESIVDQAKDDNGKALYLVKWKGYPENLATWEHFKDIKQTEAYSIWLKRNKNT